MNYHHLHYFWTVARTGSIVGAAGQLNVTQPTISVQIRSLEDSLRQKLFRRQGRGLALTEAGRLAYQYADEIFTIGRELEDVLRHSEAGRPVRITVGVTDVLSKLVTYEILRPVFELDHEIRFDCREDTPERLLAALALHELDLVISDVPIGAGSNIRAFNHLLGQSGVTIFAPPKQAIRLRRGFPRSLDGVAFLMPSRGTEIRRILDQWFGSVGIRPRIVGEFEDSALAKVFGEAGHGLFAGSSVIEEKIEEKYGVKSVGRVPRLRERFYAISAERRVKHPAVLAITLSARRDLFD